MTDIAGSAGDILRRDYGVDTFPMLFMQGNFGPGEEGHDIRTDEGASRAVDRIAGLSSLAGMVITLPARRVGKIKKHGGCFAASQGALSPPEGISSITGQEIRGADPFQGGYRNSRSAAGGRDARTFSERSAGIPIGPVSHIGNRQRYRPSRCAARVLWTEDTPWWRSFIVMERSSPRRDTWPRRSSGIRQV